MSTSVVLYLQIGHLKQLKDVTSSFVIILKQIIEHKLKDYDYHRVPAPWIQINILKLLAMIGKGDIKASEQMYEVLGMVLRKAEDGKGNIAFAVIYQCVKTIATIYPNKTLLFEASRSIS